MWSTRLPRPALGGVALLALLGLGACTLEPLNSAQSSKVTTGEIDTSTSEILSSTTVQPVGDRVSQQVRNNLLFQMNGGSLKPGGKYSVRLKVTSTSSNLSVEASSLSPTASQVVLTTNYELIEIGTNKIVAGGTRRTIAGYERTPQSFANERAERNAQNRAAKDMARLLKLALSQSLLKI